jgi:hypothetical protein
MPREIVAALIGAAATVIFTGIGGVILYSLGVIANLSVDEVLNKLEVAIIHGEYTETKNGLADYYAECPGVNDKLVGGMCQIRLGNGTLVAVGSTNRKGNGHVGYVCDYQTNDPNTLHAEVYAACLQRR